MANIVTETITPAKAQEYLRTSMGNRPISKVYVRSYADTMRKGGWALNGTTIVFDINGHLLDGHHRLHAIIEANVPVCMLVCRGVSSDVFTTFDTGRHRNVGQILAMQGVKNYNLVGSIVSANEAIIRTGRLIADNTKAVPVRQTLSDYYELYTRDREGYEMVGSYMSSLRSKCRVLPMSWAGGLYYYLTHTGGFNEEEVRPFFDCLYDMASRSVKSATLLREVIAKEAMAGHQIKAENLWAFTVKAWNAYATNTNIKFLRYVKEREELPSLVLKK